MMAAAIRKVPASMRSGITACSAPCSSCHPFDDDSSRAGAFDFRAHRDEEVGEILDFRLLGGAVDDRRSFGKHSSHHDVVGAEDR